MVLIEIDDLLNLTVDDQLNRSSALRGLYSLSGTNLSSHLSASKQPRRSSIDQQFSQQSNLFNINQNSQQSKPEATPQSQQLDSKQPKNQNPPLAKDASNGNGLLQSVDNTLNYPSNGLNNYLNVLQNGWSDIPQLSPKQRDVKGISQNGRNATNSFFDIGYNKYQDPSSTIGQENLINFSTDSYGLNGVDRNLSYQLQQRRSNAPFQNKDSLIFNQDYVELESPQANQSEQDTQAYGDQALRQGKQQHQNLSSQEGLGETSENYQRPRNLSTSAQYSNGIEEIQDVPGLWNGSQARSSEFYGKKPIQQTNGRINNESLKDIQLTQSIDNQEAQEQIKQLNSKENTRQPDNNLENNTTNRHSKNNNNAETDQTQYFSAKLYDSQRSIGSQKRAPKQNAGSEKNQSPTSYTSRSKYQDARGLNNLSGEEDSDCFSEASGGFQDMEVDGALTPSTEKQENTDYQNDLSTQTNQQKGNQNQRGADHGSNKSSEGQAIQAAVSDSDNQKQDQQLSKVYTQNSGPQGQSQPKSRQNLQSEKDNSLSTPPQGQRGNLYSNKHQLKHNQGVAYSQDIDVALHLKIDSLSESVNIDLDTTPSKQKESVLRQQQRHSRQQNSDMEVDNKSDKKLVQQNIGSATFRSESEKQDCYKIQAQSQDLSSPQVQYDSASHFKSLRDKIDQDIAASKGEQARQQGSEAPKEEAAVNRCLGESFQQEGKHANREIIQQEQQPELQSGAGLYDPYASQKVKAPLHFLQQSMQNFQKQKMASQQMDAKEIVVMQQDILKKLGHLMENQQKEVEEMYSFFQLESQVSKVVTQHLLQKYHDLKDEVRQMQKDK